MPGTFVPEVVIGPVPPAPAAGVMADVLGRWLLFAAAIYVFAVAGSLAVIAALGLAAHLPPR